MTTHDLALTGVVTALKGPAINAHSEEYYENNEMQPGMSPISLFDPSKSDARLTIRKMEAFSVPRSLFPDPCLQWNSNWQGGKLNVWSAFSTQT